MYLVFDVGGTFVKYAWMSMDGNIQEKGKYPTPTKEGESVPEFVESLGQIYDKYKDQGVEGIALSLPGLIDAENGIIRNGGGIKYLKDAHLAELLGARCDGVKISMENDGKCAALAEVWMGNAKGCKNAYKTIGRQYVEKSFHRTEIIRLDILSWSGKCKDNLHPGTTPPGANSNRT